MVERLRFDRTAGMLMPYEQGAFIRYSDYQEIDAHRRKVIAENERLINAFIEKDRIIRSLDPENAPDDDLLLDIHARLQVHGEKYPERAVSVLHRNVVLYTIQAAIAALAQKEVKP